MELVEVQKENSVTEVGDDHWKEGDESNGGCKDKIYWIYIYIYISDIMCIMHYYVQLKYSNKNLNNLTESVKKHTLWWGKHEVVINGAGYVRLQSI